ncbi:hypothetical protein [Rossellomorea sp. LjRoot5]|uniref:hypothetical protein n=1 Tax=Rossellomorea sp. LjRoot5 TaxID=3342331 RepID=UPI003F505B65
MKKDSGDGNILGGKKNEKRTNRGVDSSFFVFGQRGFWGDPVMVQGHPVRVRPEWERIQPIFENIQPKSGLIRPFLMKIRPECPRIQPIPIRNQPFYFYSQKSQRQSLYYNPSPGSGCYFNLPINGILITIKNLIP